MIIKPSNRISNVQEYYFSRKLAEIARMNQEGADVINLGIGSPDLPPPPEAVRVLVEEVSKNDTHGYQSYRGIPELREAFAEHYKTKLGVTVDAGNEILPLMGSKEGIMHVSMSFLNEEDLVLVPNPGYPSYSSVAKIAGAKCLYYDLLADHDWQPDFDQLETLPLERVKMIWINYPNMPTGAAPHPESLKKLVDLCLKHRILLCHDNPYNWVLNDKPSSIFSVPGAKECALELASLSKCYNMAGWRVGALIGNSELLQTVLRFKSNMDSGMFKPVQLAAAKALTLSDSWFQDLNEVYLKRQACARQIFDLLDCLSPDESSGLFLWAKAPEYVKNIEQWLDDILHTAKVFITPGFIFGSNGDRYVRISLCNEESTFEQAFRRIEHLFIKSMAVA